MKIPTTSRRLDRKSSRGMIYENEELRLRTLNINAEVERGQSDIKKLRRENYHLRKEIWTLRDEHDRLDKLLKTQNRKCSNSTLRQDCVDEVCLCDCDCGQESPCCSCSSSEVICHFIYLNSLAFAFKTRIIIENFLISFSF